MEGLVNGGTNYDDYNDAVVDLDTAINGMSRDLGDDFACMEVSLALDSANTEHSKAAGIWMKWYNDVRSFDTDVDLDDLPLDPHWNKADTAVARANRKLTKLKNAVGYEPTKPVEPKYVTIPQK